MHSPYSGPLIDEWGSAESSILLSLCSNITRLVINDDGVFNLSKYSPSQWGSSKYLMHLKYLEIKVGDVKPWICPIISSLLGAYPTLDVLVFNGDFSGRWHPDSKLDLDTLRPVLENLTEIRLLGFTLCRGPYETPGLTELILAARNLKTFKSIVDTSTDWMVLNQWDYEPQYPAYFIGMLKAARGSLQHLALNLDRTLVNPRFDSMYISPEEMCEFVKLQTLEIHHFCYYKHQLGRLVLKESWDRATYLADFLPTTVKKLTIFWKPAKYVYQCLDCILYLGRRAVAGDFPRLESVHIDAPIIPNKMFGDWDHETEANNRKGKIELKILELEGQACRFKEAFGGSGVVTSFRIWNAVDNVSAYLE
ncbi:hypothetical protein FLAG1_11348 [Fusarium langsethiae]|uniref:F-box protein n=1 Tax=Fusarium langsethiae TaxID=179993 RepID=A0A0M9EM88_FUSLA|nr:hypothetical protein FLAG1_11348 [Fusarium langsethiae]